MVIAQALRWVQADTWQADFNAAWQAWRSHKLQGSGPALAPFYYASFSGQGGQNWVSFYRQLQAEMRQNPVITSDISKVSRVYWREAADEDSDKSQELDVIVEAASAKSSTSYQGNTD